MSLIADLFPGITLDSATYAELQVAIANQVDAAGLVNHPSWNLKLVQVIQNYCQLINVNIRCNDIFKIF
jgi:dynein heavy chain